MAGPFANTFEDEPRTPQSAGSGNISYRTNVNRQKTTKWTQAKAVDYGGDDWGDEDDYGYDPAPPPPVSKPTGLRQQGQVLQTQPKGEPPTFSSKKAYGQLPDLPGASNLRGRSNSFDADEERNFSGATIRQPSPSTTNVPNASSSGPATRFSQITGVPSTRNPSGPPPLAISTQQPHTTGLRKTSQAISPAVEDSHIDTMSQPREHAGQTDALPVSAQIPSTSDPHTSDFQARRDYSPSAVPQPLSMRASPAPQTTQERSSSATRFPARKSSLSQMTRPNLSGAGPFSEDASTPKSWAPAARSSSPSAAAKSPTTPTTGKNLPFIRPADIYKRAEEERQSMESGRPSMDSIMGTRSNDSSESPARRPHRESPSSDNLGGGNRRRTSLDDEGSESGRRLMPMLDTVKERKSEYGFDGLDVNEPEKGQKSEQVAALGTTLQQPGINQLEVEDARRSSTSPKLPDLNRISGFGMDMFSQSTHNGPTQPLATQTGPAESTTAQTEGTTLHSQPSIGLRSVVHQAFDRTDDSSVPPTPASRTGSGVRRTDSESTGTTGISPIMSRVPSAAGPDSRNRDVSKPAILEVVNEPASPVIPDGNVQEASFSPHTSLAQPQPTIPGFKPGHRRDISTPSPGNSPARTPDLGTSATYSHGHEALITDSGHLADSGQEFSRPSAERGQSFRPIIPGGWTSYAASSRGETTPQESDIEAARKPNLGQLSTSHPTSNDDPNDITPTTIKQPLPSSASTAALAAATKETSTGGVFGEHDRGSSQTTQQPIVALPTPDPAMAPSGNVYSKSPLDPRLLPTLDLAPAETQLRPDTVHQATSAQFSIGPTPPKDMPLDREAVKDTGYFPSPGGPRESKIAGPSNNEPLGSAPKPQMISAMTTDPESQNDEDDQLHTETVKELNPHPSTSSRYDDSLSTPFDETMIEGQTRESTYLPSEYDNYWASTSDNDGAIPAIVRTPSDEAVPTAASSTFYNSLEPDTTTIPPLSPRRTAQSNDGPRPPSLQQRFSWEKSSENVSKTLSSETTTNVAAPHVSSTSIENSEAPEVVPQQETSRVSHPNAPYEGLMLDDRPSEQSGSPHQMNDSSVGREAASLVGGAAVSAGALVTGAGATSTAPSHNHPSHRLSLAEEKDPQASSYTVSPTPPEDDHPSRSPQPYFQSADQTTHTSPITSFPVNAATVVPPQQPTNDRILAFKEIAAMKSQQQRIATFNATRERYAQMDSGLNAWMMTLQAQHPEHADQTGLWGGSAQSKFARSAGSSTAPLQQPYYQQYLNASSPTTPTSTSKPGSNIPVTGAQQGFAPAGGKLTSQQVQAKGKELLHTAGIFGGKAGKAGKGLLAKGKSRLRGSGGGDKTSPPAKPKPERRSSWGPLLTLSRSSGHPDSSGHQQRNVSMTDAVPQTPPMAPKRHSFSQQSTNTDTHRAGSTSGAISVLESPKSHRESLISRDATHADNTHCDPEAEHGLGIPVPAPKEQFSLSPLSSSAITEEEPYYHDGDTIRIQPPSDDTKGPPRQLEVGMIAPPSERSNSDDTRFYSAHDTSPELSDWVMVNPESDMNVALETTSEAPGLTSQIPQSNSSTSPIATVLSAQDIQPILEPTSQVTGSGPPIGRSAISPLEGGSGVLPSSKLQSSHPLDKGIAQDSVHEGAVAVESPSTIRSPATWQGPSSSGASMNQLPTHEEPETSPEHANLSSVPQLEPGQTSAPNNYHGTHKRNVSSTSVLDRPRGGTVDDLPPQPTVHSSGSVNQIHPFVTSIDQVPIQTVRPQGSVQNSESPQHRSKEASKASFLPPIRRTSTFGLGFGPRQKSPRFPIDDDSEQSVKYDLHDPNHASQSSLQISPQESTVEQASIVKSSPTRPKIVRVGSSEYSQRAVPVQQEEQDTAPIARYVADEQDTSLKVRQSHGSWRPNVPLNSSNVPTGQRGEGPTSQSQASWGEPQRSRVTSGGVQSSAQRSEGFAAERLPWSGPSMQSKPFEQPPSSAQRYPELFRAEPGPESQREAAGVGPPSERPRSASSRRNSGFFRELGGRISRGTSRERAGPRSQDAALISPTRPFDSRGNDYASSSIASEEMKEQNKRRSKFFGNLNRASTVGLGPPQSRESVLAHHSGSRTDLLDSEHDASHSDPREKKRSFFGSSSGGVKQKPSKLSRSSTSALVEESGRKKNRFSGISGFFGKSEIASRASMPPPIQQEKAKQPSYVESPVIDSPKVSSIQYSFTTPMNRDQTVTPNHNDPKPKGSRVLSRFTSSQAVQSLQAPRKESKSRAHRSSASGLLSGIISRKSYQQEVERDETLSQGSAPRFSPQPLPLAQTYTDIQEQQQMQEQRMQEQRMQEQQMQEQRLPTQSSPTYQKPPHHPPERGRRVDREPQYDNVPIPGGYDLVRGQGAVTVPTNYDPRGLNQMQQADPHQIHRQISNSTPPYPQTYAGRIESPIHYDVDGGRPPHEMMIQNLTSEYHSNQKKRPNQPVSSPDKSKPPSLGALETYEAYQARSMPRRLSSEDLIARSPARRPNGQQRPYQLSLPGGDENDRPLPVAKDSPIETNANKSFAAVNSLPQHDSIRRLQQPILQHPGSPASYPVPDSAFSPINPNAKTLPPPAPPNPPPNWESQSSHLDPQYQPAHSPLVSQGANLGMDLNRTGTHRTTTSAVSQVSHMSGNDDAQRGRSSIQTAEDKETGTRNISENSSPGRPSPLITPERRLSPTAGVGMDRGRRDERGTSREKVPSGTLMTTTLDRGPSPDLYDASPRIPKITKDTLAASPRPSPKPSPIQTNFPTRKSSQIRLVQQESTGSNANLAPGSQFARIPTPAHEEKIVDSSHYSRAESDSMYYEMDGEPTVNMSATSYPGQEWNPYAGGYDDGFD